MKFYGIADAHGLESFEPSDFDTSMNQFKANTEKIGMMYMRVMANRQRHAVVYQADISPADAEIITEMVDKGEHSEALLKLKEVAKSISLAKIPGAEKSWNLIPNSALDTYSP